METLLSNGVNPIDLYLLQALFEGQDLESFEVVQGIKQGYGIELTPLDIEDRLKRLEDNRVIIARKTVLVDPIKLYDHVFLILLKLHLPSVVPGMGTLSWDEAMEEIWGISKQTGDPIRILFTILGWGDYDIAAVAYVNDLAAYYEFQKKLAERGIIEKYDTKTLHHYGIPYYFEPMQIPSHADASRYITALRQKLEAAGPASPS